MRVVLIAENGALFQGEAPVFFKEICFDLVFNTAMVGYTEIISDPAYARQGLIMTYPIMGSCGVNMEDMESETLPKALIVRKLCARGSNFRAEQELITLLQKHNTTCVTGIDTRSITKMLRNEGVMRAMVTCDVDCDLSEKIRIIKAYKPESSVSDISAKDIWTTEGSGQRIAALDLGITRSMLERFKARDARLTVFPAHTKADAIISGDFDGIFISSGPEAAADNGRITREIAILADSGLPLFAVGLGHQLLALARGGKIEKLKSVHCGANHPVMDIETKRVYITNHNQRYTVKMDGLKGAEATHIHLNDRTVEGIRYLDRPMYSVSFYPDLNEGVVGTSHLFDKFLSMGGGANAKV